MKPLRLKMQAFGSYGKETTIDFEKVNQNLFLITGDTGAGKNERSLMRSFLLYMAKQLFFKQKRRRSSAEPVCGFWL